MRVVDTCARSFPRTTNWLLLTGISDETLYFVVFNIFLSKENAMHEGYKGLDRYLKGDDNVHGGNKRTGDSCKALLCISSKSYFPGLHVVNNIGPTVKFSLIISYFLLSLQEMNSHEDDCFLGCCAVQSVSSLLTLQRCWTAAISDVGTTLMTEVASTSEILVDFTRLHGTTTHRLFYNLSLEKFLWLFVVAIYHHKYHLLWLFIAVISPQVSPRMSVTVIYHRYHLLTADMYMHCYLLPSYRNWLRDFPVSAIYL